EFLRDERGLRAFARSGRAEKDQTHVVPAARKARKRTGKTRSRSIRVVAGTTLAPFRGKTYATKVAGRHDGGLRSADAAVSQWSRAGRHGDRVFVAFQPARCQPQACA